MQTNAKHKDYSLILTDNIFTFDLIILTIINNYEYRF